VRLFEILDALLLLCVVVGLSASFAYLWSLGRLFSSLRRFEPSVFKSLGEPSLLRPFGSSRSAVMAYLSDRDYETSVSTAVQIGGQTVRRLLVVGRSALLSSFALAITMAFMR
jgi:hypothetical protein